MVGNVWEWVDAPVEPDDSQFNHLREELPGLSPPLTRTEAYYQIRGGDMRLYLPDEAAAGRVNDFGVMAARVPQPSIGFRCARGVRQTVLQ